MTTLGFEHLMLYWEQAIYVLVPLLMCLYVLFGLDDLFIDFYASFRGSKPQELSTGDLERIRRIPQKKLAVIVAAWQEGGILGRMVRRNVSELSYSNFDFYLGVYPNDAYTRREAQALAKAYPNVRVVINGADGPTSKGQMLNEIVKTVFAEEVRRGVEYDAFVVHDSEDLIHRDAFHLLNSALNDHDFVQLPVFPIRVPAVSLVAGTYIDEFAEAHTKDVLVRNALGAPIPSAGVGTALSRRLVRRHLERNGGGLFNAASVTEDYELGMLTGVMGFRSKFLCHFAQTPAGDKDFIATREYFPRGIVGSLRQRSRWTLGIAFQGSENLGWTGTLWHRYFLYRDRKAPAANLLTLAGGGLFLYLFAEALLGGYYLEDFYATPLGAASVLTTSGLMLNRIFQRVRSVWRVHGAAQAVLTPIRIPVANVINALAALSAFWKYTTAKIRGAVPVWAKTTHEFPAEATAEAEEKAG